MSVKLVKGLWFAAFMLIILIFVAYSVALPQLFGKQVQQAWQWLLPNLLPPFGIVFGIDFIAQTANLSNADDGGAAGPKATAPQGIGLAFGMSAFYILVLLVSVIGVLFTDAPIDFLGMTNYWLAPLLALTTAILGARFAKRTA